MKINKLALVSLLSVVLLFSCKKESTVDTAKTSTVTFKLEKEIALEGSDKESAHLSAEEVNKQYTVTLAKSLSHEKSSDGFYTVKEELDGNLGNHVEPKKVASISPDYPDNYIPGIGGVNGRILNDGIKYRVLIYNTATGAYVKQVDGTVGTAAVVEQLDQGTTYTWYAYSYYSKSNLAPIANDKLLTPTFDVENEDFLYATGQFTAAQGAAITNTPVVLRFKHMMAMIEVAVNVSGFSAKSYNAEFTGTNAIRPYIRTAANTLEKGVFNLKTGTFQSKQIISSAVYVNAKENYSYLNDLKSSSYHGFLYTVPGADADVIPNFTYELETWLKLDRPAAPKKFNKTYVESVRKGRGKFTRLTTTAIDNGVAVPIVGSSTAATIRWARGDLFYDESQSTLNEAFTRFQHRSHEATSIFYSSTFQPNGISGAVANQYGASPANYGSTYYLNEKKLPLGIPSPTAGDPCDLLAPESGPNRSNWRKPTADEGLALAKYINANAGNGRVSHTYNTTTRSIVLTVNTTAASSPDEWSERLSFEAKGYALPNGTNYKMADASIPYKTPATAPSVQKGTVYLWLLGDGSNIATYSYLEIIIDSSASTKYVAKVYKSWITSNTTDFTKAPILASSNPAMSIRCIRK